MKKALILSVFCTATLAGCNQKQESTANVEQQVNPICSTEQLAGGWTETEITPEVQQALDFVLSQMNTAAKLQEITQVRSQVVNGLNYAIEFKMDDGQVWHTLVYRSLKGELTMSQPAQHGELCQ